MAPRHVVEMSTSHATHGVCVRGTELFLDTRRSTPRGAASFDVHATPAGTVHMIHSPATKPTADSRWPLDRDIEVVVTIDSTSRTIDDNQVKISYYNREGNELAVAWLYLTCVDVSLDVDVSRSGRVKSKGKDKAKWTWGPDGQGAVLLVNCDRDSPGAGGTDSGQADIRTPADLQDMSVMLLRTQGPSAVFAEYQVVLHVPETDADKVRVFHATRGDSHPHYKPVLGPDKLSYVLDRAGLGDSTFYVEGLAFPDRGFSGLVSFSASLLEVPHKDSPGTPIFTDTVVFRVAPWIMTPNTQQPLEVFVCSIKQGSDSNEAFMEGLRALLRKANCKLTVCSEQDTRSDRWIQDELEFGYVEAPHKTFPVVFDSPRNRGLKDFAFKKILGPDFGPPGSVPQGFRLLLASPSACYQLFREKQRQGHGEATQFIGLKGTEKKSIDEILADESLRSDNRHVQRLGRPVGIPKPFGPAVGGRCCLEQRVRELLEPLGLSCTFIDDFFSYHVLAGDVHCGTNVRRKPFAFKWWHVVP
ncbi:PREDICTED: LOW QUALITY PROTEIN: protein-arginine deiminase type-1 [Corvus brachyrhynchos]|uniref:LOW QUALITY PROTEIN: protein-arginine deiminase type-1 n=1 Tax=Corvus brachyrhynchos TaxID=85066 RepID=UPI00081644D2|nr:PREDICTED: LOW QUALITY PROTEIN: protein-arginine deiminase type-1 [Corvus brachyrhynchos]